ncbi:alpha/beta hydrolase family protein [Thalassotalea fusca]
MPYFLFILLTLTFTVSAAQKPLPVEAFGKLPSSSQVKLSPNGKKFAYIKNIEGYSLIGVVTIATGDNKFIVKTDNQKYKINWYQWANNEMLLVSAAYPQLQYGLKFSESRLLKVSVDGKSVPTTIYRPKTDENVPQFQDRIVDILPDDPDHILVQLDVNVANMPDVYKVNLNSVRKKSLHFKRKSYINNWMTDQQHRIRLGFGRDDTSIFYRLYDLATEEWRTIWRYEIFDAPDITPLGFGLNENELYIRAIHNKRYAIFKVDVSTKDLKRTLVYADEKYDIEGSLIYSRKTGDVIGVYHGEAEQSKIYFSEEHQAFQTALNKAIPDAYNNVVSYSENERKYILFSSDDKNPGAYLLGDRDAGSLELVAYQYPLLVDQQQSGRQKVTYKARDGLEIEGYVTMPYGGLKKNNPVVIMPHGGPMVRNYGGFDWFSEFLASRGYLIMEPNFRGSSGYGFEFEMAAIQEWGGAMQDDLQDAALWVQETFDAGKNNTCIFGASYGGYAALMAASIQQSTFKCAASFAGVSDLEDVVRRSRRFTNYDVVKKQFGTDDDTLERQSPINYAKQINIPILLIHGEDDRVVDVRHSRNMFDELKDYDKKVDYIELPQGNHHLEIEKNRLAVLTSLEKFLSVYLQ